MSIETEAELEGLRRAGRAVAVVLRELRRRVQPGVTTGKLDVTAELDGFFGDACVTVPVAADGAPAAHVEHTIVVTDGAPLILTR